MCQNRHQISSTMIRAKMQAKFGKSETAPPPPPGEVGEGEQPVELSPEESAQQEESELLIVKAVNHVRNMLIQSGLEGGLSVSTERLLMEQEWEFDVTGEDQQVMDPQYLLTDDSTKEKLLRKAINACVGRMIAMMKRKANSWRNVPYKDSGTMSVSATVTIAIISITFGISASIPSVLAFADQSAEAS